jgi:cytoskeletal protein CcmA (bactofilin family)
MFTSKNAKTASSEKVETIVGPGTAVQGNILATGTVRVDGRVIGEIQTEGDIIVGEKGQVNGIVKGRDITIAGSLEGNVDASGRLHIVSTGKVNGDIVVESLMVEDGAKYKGNCKMKTDVKGAEPVPQL